MMMNKLHTHTQKGSPRTTINYTQKKSGVCCTIFPHHLIREADITKDLIALISGIMRPHPTNTHTHTTTFCCDIKLFVVVLFVFNQILCKPTKHCLLVI